jgi:hypothetical protein
MFETITLHFSEEPTTTTIPAQGITIFVGPNNSGKSLVLREIEAATSSHPKPQDLKIVDDFELQWPSKEEIERDIAASEKKRPLGIPEGQVHIGRFNPGGAFEGQTLDRATLENFCAQRTKKHWVASQFLRFWMIRLDGRTRFNLTNDHPQGDLLSPTPANLLAHLFTDDKLRNEVRATIHNALGVYFIVDPTSGGQLRMRLSQGAPTGDEQSLNAAARTFHRNALYIKEASDGVQAYVGIVTAVLAGEYRAILIDEPEAFLHPPLARKLGADLATVAMKRGGSLLASTHSPDFLIGCVQASIGVRVVRLEYSNGKSRGRLVDSVALDRMFKSPLMRSANVFSALFHDGVVVTESDNDRVFYSEIYHRLAEQEKGYPSVLFVNAQNKQTIGDIMSPLREFGIPVAAVADIDILKDGGKVWTAWLAAARLPQPLHAGVGLQRDAVKKCFDAAGKDMKRDGGVEALPRPDAQAANQLFDLMDDYGVFVVRKGELEHWMPTLGAVGKKTDWVISVLERLGSDPKDAAYMKPAEGDVWDFVRSMVKWIKDPSRKGTA